MIDVAFVICHNSYKDMKLMLQMIYREIIVATYQTSSAHVTLSSE